MVDDISSNSRLMRHSAAKLMGIYSIKSTETCSCSCSCLHVSEDSLFAANIEREIKIEPFEF